MAKKAPVVGSGNVFADLGLILVDDQRTVLRVWEGQLSRKTEDEVKAAILDASSVVP